MTESPRRMDRRLRFPAAAMVAAVVAVVSTVESSGESPRTFLADIYVQYTDEEAPVLVWNGEDAPRLFEPALAAAISSDALAADRRIDGRTRFDHDPFVQGDDCSLKGLSIKILDSAANTARGIVTFRNHGRPARIQFDLVRYRGAWRIQDMRWDQTSLRVVYGLP
ncbi:MAG: hypothetical protein JXO72_04810 [Vicinamibacteria bacterium]|nr:hypothetical protein [Vicinamibacteria bacterium]